MSSAVFRDASLNETRCIFREQLGLYGNLVVGAIYRIPRSVVSEDALGSIQTYAFALVECIKRNAFLSASIDWTSNPSPQYLKSDVLDLINHFRVIANTSWIKSKETSEEDLLAQIISKLHDDPFYSLDLSVRPPWSLDIFFMPRQSKSEYHRVFISFTYSHSLADGISGLIFHRTFLAALNQAWSHPRGSVSLIVKPTHDTLLAQPDTPASIPLTKGYILTSIWMRLASSLNTISNGLIPSSRFFDKNTWTGAQSSAEHKTQDAKPTSHAKLWKLDTQVLRKLLLVCKNNNVKLTALLNHFITHAISLTLMDFQEHVDRNTNFMTVIPMNIRQSLGFPSDVMGNYVSGVYFRQSFEVKKDQVYDEAFWNKVRNETNELSKLSSTAENHSLALLRFVSDIKAWTQNKIGGPRDGSWELSNLGLFDTQSLNNNDQNSNPIVLDEMFFSQPASPVESPLKFNVVSLKSRGLNMIVTWQEGSMDLNANTCESVGNQEDKFVETMLEHLTARVGCIIGYEN